MFIGQLSSEYFATFVPLLLMLSLYLGPQVIISMDTQMLGSIDHRKSTNGYALFVGSNNISRTSRKQRSVSRSSTEAEYRALAAATSEITWLQFWMSEIAYPSSQTTLLWCDNLSATYLTANPLFHSRTKHLDFHFVRDKVTQKAMQVRYISSCDQLADCLTKPLSKNRFLLTEDRVILYWKWSLKAGIFL